MNKSFTVYLLLFLINFLIVNVGPCFGSNDEKETKGLSIETSAATSIDLADPANQTVLDSLRERAAKEHLPEAMLALVNFGDSHVINESVADLDDRTRRRQAERILEKSTQPKIIRALGDDLNSHESAVLKFTVDVGIAPKSVTVGLIIRAIILNSPAFNPEVKQWASGTLGFDSSLIDKTEFRRQMRAWWLENRALILAEKYNEVKPPSTWKAN